MSAPNPKQCLNPTAHVNVQPRPYPCNICKICICGNSDCRKAHYLTHRAAIVAPKQRGQGLFV